jgi:hypothetical protein
LHSRAFFDGKDGGSTPLMNPSAYVIFDSARLG